MKDQEKSIEQLTAELASLRQKVAELEELSAEHDWVDKTLREREERYRAIVEAFDGLIYICSEDNRIEFMNEELIKRTGYDATGEICYRVLHDRDSVCPWCVKERVLEGETVRWELESPKDNRWYYVVNTPIYNADGTISKQAMILDITERKAMEEALEKSAEKIKHFAYSVSHDLKSPAAAIYGLTKRLHDHHKDSLDEKGRRYCDQILRASLHVGALIEKINAYIEAQEAPLKVEDLDLKEILQIIKDEFSPRLTIRQIKWQEPDFIPIFKGDKIAIIRVFRNFVDNALKYGGENLSEIRVGYEESDDFHIFSVCDDGVGLRVRDYESLFAAFRRDDSSKSVEGAGLGLAIVSEIAERLRGKVWADTGKNKGATFYMSVSKDL
ncbi:MAG: PAS domain S-box protein [Deltaproteobacteria bacterium]|nr:PAS domain S-box protein [Deltaproteobacteria bacterium]